MGVARKHRTETPGRRRLALGSAAVALGVVAVGIGVWLVARPPEASATRALATPTRAVASVRKQMPDPVRISIPTIGVDARVIPLGLNPDRTIQVPTSLADTGWFKPGPEPGEQGAAVIVGHLASSRGPGVFWRLRELRRGDVIAIHLRDGSTVRFAAQSMIRVPKSRFPTDRVYARTSQPTLRLITCAGKLNPATGHHPDNDIVFASLVPRATAAR